MYFIFSTFEIVSDLDKIVCFYVQATGYCNNTIVNGTETGACNFKPITLGPEHANASYHYVPDVAWDIVDLIQVACFAEFNASYRMFHVLEQAAEKLFTLQVKNLWYAKKTYEKNAGFTMNLIFMQVLSRMVKKDKNKTSWCRCRFAYV